MAGEQIHVISYSGGGTLDWDKGMRMM
uniref:Uncharacterized protein n=1 Tax=Nelumbo nucifera TaxID=4432 RepID=A0A822YIT1_NELNU|nr:TPA_asm: hypothetical protein HUJ06_030776 [Nelumbo nucifera]